MAQFEEKKECKQNISRNRFGFFFSNNIQTDCINESLDILSTTFPIHTLDGRGHEIHNSVDVFGRV